MSKSCVWRELPIGAAIKTLLRAFRVTQMPDQFAGRAIDIDPPLDRRVSCPRGRRSRGPAPPQRGCHRYSKYGRSRPTSDRGPEAKLRFLGGESQINPAICPSADLPAVPGILQAPSASDASGWPFHRLVPRPSGYRAQGSPSIVFRAFPQKRVIALGYIRELMTRSLPNG